MNLNHVVCNASLPVGVRMRSGLTVYWNGQFECMLCIAWQSTNQYHGNNHHSMSAWICINKHHCNIINRVPLLWIWTPQHHRFNAVEVKAWVSNYIPQIYADVITDAGSWSIFMIYVDVIRMYWNALRTDLIQMVPTLDWYSYHEIEQPMVIINNHHQWLYHFPTFPTLSLWQRHRWLFHSTPNKLP